jgi:hypothetical protein
MFRPLSASLVIVSLMVNAAQASIVLTGGGDPGTTLVNQGEGFSPVTGASELKPGDRIMVKKGGTATITYPGGCTVPVHGIATVGALSPCDFMAADLPSRKAPPEPYVQPVVEEPFPYLPVALVALAGGGIACAVLCFHHGNNNPPFIPPVFPVSP